MSWLRRAGSWFGGWLLFSSPCWFSASFAAVIRERGVPVIRPCLDFYVAAVASFVNNESRKPLTTDEKRALRGSREARITTLEAAARIIEARRELLSSEVCE